MIRRDRLAFLAGLEFAQWQPVDVVKTLHELGYGGVEWTMAHFNPRTKSKRELEKLVRIPHDFGMEVSEVVLQQDFVVRDEKEYWDRIERVKDGIEVAGDIGINIANLFTGPAPWDPLAPEIPKDISEGVAWDMVTNAFQELLPVAEKHGVYLAVEAVFEHLCHDYYTTAELFRRLNSEYLAINMDPSHYQLYGNDICWVTRQRGDRIKHVHLKDVIGVPGEMGKAFLFPLLGEGSIDWHPFLQALSDVGYDGFLSIEFESFGYYEKVMRRDAVEAARMSLCHIEKILEL